jgi:hypothetical protein
MKKAKKSKAVKKSKEAKRATLAKKPKAAKKTMKAKKRAKAKPSTTGPLGCCTITYDDGTSDEPIENISKPDCIREANVRRGIFQWNPGSCA